MTDYGDVDILWLDGGWVQKRDQTQTRRISQDIKMDQLVEKCREKQPGLIVVDRAVHGPNQNYLTPENRVPERTLPYPWESPMISIEDERNWAYKPDANYMSGREAVHMLIDIVSKGGNLLLNIGPGPNGKWQDGAYKLLDQIGNWMDINQEAIYNSEPIMPYKKDNICMTEQQDGQVYYFYIADQDDHMPEAIEIRSHKPVANATVTLLGIDEELDWEEKRYGFEIHIPKEIQSNPPCRYAWTFEVSDIR
jgi:alpha-L-fucosidase